MAKPNNPVLIRRIRPRNFLSFGPDNADVELQALNVLIGANGSGKSNLIEAISLMRAATNAFRDVTKKGGGAAEWIWKGSGDDPASVEWVVNGAEGAEPLRHGMWFRCPRGAFVLFNEVVERCNAVSGQPTGRYLHRRAVENPDGSDPRVAGEELDPDRSILFYRRDPKLFPRLTRLAQRYEKIRIYREWRFGRGAVFREPQRADMPNIVLEEDFSNLGLFLSRLKSRFPAAKRSILEGLKDLYDGIQDFDVHVEGGTVQVVFTEGDFPIPAMRLSDGTLRYLCLLAILCDPEPPPLVCLEEPELGLHPDILPKVADLIKEFSKRSQIIVTTHSDILVDAMTETPEAVIVCEKHEGKTELTRLSAPDLAVWLEKYRLGQLWTRGEIGGTRW